MSQGLGKYDGSLPAMIIGDQYVILAGVDPPGSGGQYTLSSGGVQISFLPMPPMMPWLPTQGAQMVSIAGLNPGTSYRLDAKSSQQISGTTTFTTATKSQLAGPSGVTYNVQGSNVFVNWTSSSNIFNEFLSTQSGGIYMLPPWYTGTEVYVDGVLKFTQTGGSGMSAIISGLSPGGHTISLIDNYFISSIPSYPYRMGPTYTLRSLPVGFSVTISGITYQSLTNFQVKQTQTNGMTFVVSWTLGATGASAPVTVEWNADNPGIGVNARGSTAYPPGTTTVTVDLGKYVNTANQLMTFTAWVGPRPVNPTNIIISRYTREGITITSASISSVSNGIVVGTVNVPSTVAYISAVAQGYSARLLSNGPPFQLPPLAVGSYNLYLVPYGMFNEAGQPYSLGVVNVPPAIENLKITGRDLSWTVGQGPVDSFLITGKNNQTAIVQGTTTVYTIPYAMLMDPNSWQIYVQAKAGNNLGASSSIWVDVKVGAPEPTFIGVTHITENSAEVFWESAIPYDSANVSWFYRGIGSSTTTIQVSGSPVVLSNLIQGTQYEVDIVESLQGVTGMTRTVLFTTLGNSYSPVVGPSGVTNSGTTANDDRGTTTNGGDTGTTDTPTDDSFWSRYKWYIVGGISLAVLIVIIIVVVMMTRRKS